MKHNRKIIKGKINYRTVTKVIVVWILLLTIPFIFLHLNSLKIKKKNCIAKREYIQQEILAIAMGKYDDGKTMIVSNVGVCIDIKNSNHNVVKTIDGKTQNCFVVSYEDEMLFTIRDIRGEYFNKNGTIDKPFIECINSEVVSCPFSSKKEYKYYILNNGTVICDCPYCN